MLRIKDNVDLKVLEKYEFEREHCDAIMEYLDNYIYKSDGNSIYIDMDDREIMIDVIEDYFDVEEIILNKLYDLIKDGLVEKVENEN